MRGFEIENTLTWEGVTHSIYLRFYTTIRGKNALNETIDIEGNLCGEGRFASTGKVVFPRKELNISLWPPKFQVPRREEKREISFYDIFLHKIWRSEVGSLSSYYTGMYLTKILAPSLGGAFKGFLESLDQKIKEAQLCHLDYLNPPLNTLVEPLYSSLSALRGRLSEVRSAKNTADEEFERLFKK